MVQSQGVSLQLWRHAVGEPDSRLCDEHTTTNSSPDNDTFQTGFVEAVNATSFRIYLRLLPDIDFMDASHLSVVYTFYNGENAHLAQNFIRAGDETFNAYSFHPRCEGHANPIDASHTTDQSHQTNHTFAVQVIVTRGSFSGHTFEDADGIVGRPIKLMLYHAERARLMTLGVVEAEDSVPNEPVEAEVQAEVTARTGHSSLP